MLAGFHISNSTSAHPQVEHTCTESDVADSVFDVQRVSTIIPGQHGCLNSIQLEGIYGLVEVRTEVSITGPSPIELKFGGSKRVSKSRVIVSQPAFTWPSSMRTTVTLTMRSPVCSSTSTCPKSRLVRSVKEINFGSPTNQMYIIDRVEEHELENIPSNFEGEGGILFTVAYLEPQKIF